MTTAVAWIALALSTITAGYLAGAWWYVNRATRIDDSEEEDRADLRRFLTPPPDGPDYTGMPGTEQCLCGCTLFHAAISFEAKEVAYYILEGICFGCGAKVALPYVGDDEEESSNL